MRCTKLVYVEQSKRFVRRKRIPRAHQKFCTALKSPALRFRCVRGGYERLAKTPIDVQTACRPMRRTPAASGDVDYLPTKYLFFFGPKNEIIPRQWMKSYENEDVPCGSRPNGESAGPTRVKFVHDRLNRTSTTSCQLHCRHGFCRHLLIGIMARPLSHPPDWPRERVRSI